MKKFAVFIGMIFLMGCGDGNRLNGATPDESVTIECMPDGSNWECDLPDGTSISLVGEKGEKGEPGINGIDGLPGADGAVG